MGIREVLQTDEQESGKGNNEESEEAENSEGGDEEKSDEMGKAIVEGGAQELH